MAAREICPTAQGHGESVQTAGLRCFFRLNPEHGATIVPGLCDPPPTYAGLCGPVKLSDMSLADMEVLELVK